jgi:hypothetical protein
MAAAGEQIGHVRFRLQVDLISRAPGRDVITLGADSEYRRADVGERDRPAVGQEATFGKIVMQK